MLLFSCVLSLLSFPFLSFPFLPFPFLSLPFLSFPFLSFPFLSAALLSSPLLSSPLPSSPLLSTSLLPPFHPLFPLLSLPANWPNTTAPVFVVSDRSNNRLVRVLADGTFLGASSVEKEAPLPCNADTRADTGLVLVPSLGLNCEFWYFLLLRSAALLLPVLTLPQTPTSPRAASRFLMPTRLTAALAPCYRPSRWLISLEIRATVSLASER